MILVSLLTFIYGCFYKLSKILNSDNLEESAKLYICWTFAGFTIPFLCFLLFKLDINAVWIWVGVILVYIIILNHLLRALFIDKIAKNFKENGNAFPNRVNSIVIVLISALLLFGPIALGFFIISFL